MGVSDLEVLADEPTHVKGEEEAEKEEEKQDNKKKEPLDFYLKLGYCPFCAGRLARDGCFDVTHENCGNYMNMSKDDFSTKLATMRRNLEEGVADAIRERVRKRLADRDLENRKRRREEDTHKKQLRVATKTGPAFGLGCEPMT